MVLLPFKEEYLADSIAIYRQGIESRNATFETEIPSPRDWLKKFHRHLMWVAIDQDKVIGWAGLQPVSTRTSYAGVAEVTIYVRNGCNGQGVGGALMRHLVDESEKAGIWTLYSSIFPENLPSIKLHLRNGFREIGYRERIAQLDGQWRNTVLFERRSKKVGA